VTQDKPTRKILENFAEAYWESETPISLLKSISDLAGGAIPLFWGLCWPRIQRLFRRKWCGM